MSVKKRLKGNWLGRKLILPAYRLCQRVGQCWSDWRGHFYSGGLTARSHSVFYIAPSEIIRLTDFNPSGNAEPRNRNFPMLKFRGKIVSGDWDLGKEMFDQLSVCRAIFARVSHGSSWTKTNFHEECISDISSGRILWGCSSTEDFDQRLKLVDQIIDDIRRNGFKAGYESLLPGEDEYKLSKHSRYSDEITVNIGRDGDFLFQDGRHRLAIAKALGIPMVPVKILVRHSDWLKKLKSGTVEYWNHPDWIRLSKGKRK